MNPTSLTLDESTGAIRLPIGGTGGFVARLVLKDGVQLDTENDVVLFAVSRSRDISVRAHNAAIILKELPILLDENEEPFVQIDFYNADTRGLTPGRYVWDLTLVTDPERDSNGAVIVEDNSDNVIPIFAKNKELPTFTLCEVTVIV